MPYISMGDGCGENSSISASPGQPSSHFVPYYSKVRGAPLANSRDRIRQLPLEREGAASEFG